MKLVLPYPVSANRYWRSFAYLDKATRKPRSVTVPSDEAKAYKQEIGWRARAAGCRTPTSKPIALRLVLCPRRNKDGSPSAVVLDLGNCLKVAEDALQGIVYENDKQVRSLRLDYGEPTDEGQLVVHVDEFKAELNDLLEGVPLRTVLQEVAPVASRHGSRKDGAPF